MQVEASTSRSFREVVGAATIQATPETGYAAKVKLDGLPAGQEIFFRVGFCDQANDHRCSPPQVGQFRTPSIHSRSIRFAWSGDTAGQGWGIDVQRGGMKTYSTMLSHDPDFFIHSGDTIYADGPILAVQKMPNGSDWNNLVEEGVEKVAESLEEFRGRWRYNLLDENVRAFNAAVPAYYTWDDHEVVDNWSPSKSLIEDQRYTEKSVDVLVSRARRAFTEMLPVPMSHSGEEPFFRKVSYGPLLDLFFLDLRSYRGPNRKPDNGFDDTVFGSRQFRWLSGELATSSATWKVIAAGQPIGVPIYDDWRTASGIEGIADGQDKRPNGREAELAKLLSDIKHNHISNVVWLCADVHYTAAHHYDPNRAVFRDFLPFWEFVAGPVHAGTFPQSRLDQTFGPKVVFVRAPTPEQGVNLSPSYGMQFFGIVDIDGHTERLTVRLIDRNDVELYSVTLDPEYGR